MWAKAHFGRASFSQLPAAVTRAYRKGWIPQIRRCKYPSQHMAIGVKNGQAGRGSWKTPGTADAWCTFFPWQVGIKGALKAQNRMKLMFSTTIANYKGRVLRHNLGIIQSRIYTGVHCLKTNQFEPSFRMQISSKII